MIRKFKCCRCDEIFDEDNSETVRQYVGEFWGAPAYDDYVGCPNCLSTEIERYDEDEDENQEDE